MRNISAYFFQLVAKSFTSTQHKAALFSVSTRSCLSGEFAIRDWSIRTGVTLLALTFVCFHSYLYLFHSHMLMCGCVSSVYIFSLLFLFYPVLLPLLFSPPSSVWASSLILCLLLPLLFYSSTPPPLSASLLSCHWVLCGVMVVVSVGDVSTACTGLLLQNYRSLFWINSRAAPPDNKEKKIDR